VTGRRIAVIGGGISGLTAAHILARTDEVTVLEADGRLGGHADTRLVTGPGGTEIAMDTGFIVYNERSYPMLTRLLGELGVGTRASEMSMSVSCAGCGVRYAGKRGPAGLGAGLPRGGAPYLRMLAEVPRFHRAARKALAAGVDGGLSLGDFLRAGRFSGLELLGVESLRPHYVRTIRAWLDNLERNFSAVEAAIGAERARLWRLYLAGGALAFEEGRMGVDQVLAARRG